MMYSALDEAEGEARVNKTKLREVGSRLEVAPSAYPIAKTIAKLVSGPAGGAGLVVDYVDRDGTQGFRVTGPVGVPDPSRTLAEARRGFRTTLLRKEGGGGELATPPADVFTVVRYDAPPGKLPAYLTPDPGDGRKRPAIVWITGGDCNTIDEGCWREGSGQAAGEYRKAGVVMMFPALRGGNDTPGTASSLRLRRACA